MNLNDIQRVKGCVGGYITLDCDIFDRQTFKRILNVLDEDLQGHEDHQVSYRFHKKGEYGVVDPVNINAIAAWRCHDCKELR